MGTKAFRAFCYERLFVIEKGTCAVGATFRREDIMKKRTMMTKVTAAALAGVMAMGMLTACGGSSNADTAATADSSASTVSADAKKVKVGISAENKPYSYMNENEEYEGYEYAILCEIQNRIGDQYDMDIVMDEWTNLLVGIDTGNYAAAAGSFGYKEERAEKYSYSAIPTVDAGKFYIGYLKGRTDITDMASLAGKTVATIPGLLAETIVLDWNAEHPDQEIHLEYPDGYETISAGLKNGLYDAYIATSIEMMNFNEQYDNFMDVSDDCVYESDNGGIYFLFSKNEGDFQTAFDTALKEMKEDGTLGKLCEEWIGEDLTE